MNKNLLGGFDDEHLTNRSQCADITFRASASDLAGDACKTSAGVSFSPVNQQVNGSTVSANSTAGGTKPGNAGSVAGVNMVVLSSVVGLTIVAGLGISL